MSPNANVPEWLSLEITARGGVISLSEYMELCLYHPLHGYYTRLRTVGKDGDFITAPEVTPLFGKVIGQWVHTQWQKLGEPAAWALLEVGAGTGALMESVLTTVTPTWAGILEISPALQHTQQHRLGSKVTWVDTLAQAPNLPLIILGNEVMDAFPVRQYWLEDAGWQELGLNANLQASFIPCNTEPPYPADWEPEPGAVWEDMPTLWPWLKNISQRLQATGGALWLADYGYTRLPPSGGDTVQALHKHQHVALTHLPGETDLTAHVDFLRARNALGTGQIEDMAPFLLANGLTDFAQAADDPATAAALRRLLHPEEMGALFKILEASWPLK